MAENSRHLFEKICKRHIDKTDTLTLSQRFIIYQTLLLVKKGHTCKITYKIPFHEVNYIRKKLAKFTMTDYSLRNFLEDFRVLAKKQVCFSEETGKKRECTYLTNLDIDYIRKVVSYNFCKDMSETCMTYEGKNFILQILDFAALETDAGKRMFLLLMDLNNKSVSVHKIDFLSAYFCVNKLMKNEEFLEKVICFALKELNHKILFTVKNVAAKLIVQNSEDFIKISFIRKRRNKW